MRFIKMIIIMCSFFILADPGFAEVCLKPGVEPHGFRDIKWGTKISQLPDMRVNLKIFNGPTKYKREDEDLRWENAELKEVFYVADQDERFYAVEVFTSGDGNWEKIKNTLTKEMGEDYRTVKRRSKDIFEWKNDHLKVTLEYSQKSKGTKLSINYLPGQNGLGNSKAGRCCGII